MYKNELLKERQRQAEIKQKYSIQSREYLIWKLDGNLIDERRCIKNDKRFTEESFPVKEVSVESAREKNIRHGHISTLHIW